MSKIKSMRFTLVVASLCVLLYPALADNNVARAATDAPATTMPILASPPEAQPRISGPHVFGARASHPFLYTIPASGERPLHFGADGLPNGLVLDSATGQITGSIARRGEYAVIFRATNARGSAQFDFKIIIGDKIALTPPMGWNSYNCWGINIDQDKVLRSARAIVAAGLDRHGWTYVNIDDGWQGQRGGEFNAIQPDPRRFPDMKGMCDEIHAMGLKVGIYSTPWVTSYGNRVGGSSSNPQGQWDASMRTGKKNIKQLPFAIGEFHFFEQDARQWSAWGIDYLKFDWAPNEIPETQEMSEALNRSGRDVVYSLSNNTTNSLFNSIPRISQIANSWRISGDINDSWKSVVGHGFGQDRWAPYAGPGHWNDPDMFEVGTGGGGESEAPVPRRAAGACQPLVPAFRALAARKRP